MSGNKWLPEAASQNWADLPTWSQTVLNTHRLQKPTAWRSRQVCFLRAGGMKRKAEGVQGRDARSPLQTNQSGKTLLGPRGTGEGSGRGLGRSLQRGPFHEEAELCVPGRQLGLTRLRVADAMVLRKESPFHPSSLRKQLAATHGDVVPLGNERPIRVGHPQEYPTSHSANGRLGRGKEEREGAGHRPRKPTRWQCTPTSRKQSV